MLKGKKIKHTKYPDIGIEQFWHLFDFLDQSNRHKMLEMWAGNDPLVRRVLQGETTFVETVKPLIDENDNLRLFGLRACDSNLFVIVAEKCREQFANILSFQSVYQGTLVDLTAVVNRSQWLWRELKFLISFLLIWGALWLCCYWFFSVSLTDVRAIFVTLLAIFLYCVERAKQYMTYLRHRRGYAEKTLANAKFLDTVVATVRGRE